jgi:HD-like signal output (HDOD) protein
MAGLAQTLCHDITNCGIVHDLLEEHLARGDFVVPMLPEVAVKVVRTGTRDSINAQRLSDIIASDPTLTMHVLRIAASAANRAATPIASLPHAVAWLGFDEVANIAFTLALQGKMLDVPGQQRKARRLWRHSLASALWSRQLALMVARETGLSYLCGLVHNIGKSVTLGAAHELARQTGATLSGEDYERLVGTFHREVTARVVKTWHLPPPILMVVTRWEAEKAGTVHTGAVRTGETHSGDVHTGDVRTGDVHTGTVHTGTVRTGDAHSDAAPVGDVQVECDIVNLAHRLADCTLLEPTHLSRELLVREPAYRSLGLAPADGAPLFDSAADISAELDRYLAP